MPLAAKKAACKPRIEGQEAVSSFVPELKNPTADGWRGWDRAIATACSICSGESFRIRPAMQAAESKWMKLHIWPFNGPKRDDAPRRPASSLAAT